MTSAYLLDRLEVDPDARRLLIDGKAVSVGARAFDVLRTLYERRDRVVTKHELLDLVWPGLVVEENNLQVQISSLRKLLGPQAIATIPGRGYRFTAAQSPSEAGHAANDAAPPTTQPGNLPLQLPPMFGRAEDLRRLVALVEAHPLITVVGAAGIGKTTLAVSACSELRTRWRDGVWVAELASLIDPALLPTTIAEMLRIKLGGPGSARDQLLAGLRTQSMLLLLDNCEHLVDAVGVLAADIIAGAPGVRVLSTSQELLGIPGETLFPLEPLAVPAAGERPDESTHGAVRLLVERARMADPRFALSADNAEVVAEICRQLDGLPLAIELAAARVRLLGLNGVRDRIAQRFRLLIGGSRQASQRYKTLRGALDWSYALLTTDEQAVLRRLGIFVGGFSMELAQQATADDTHGDWAVLDALNGLVDKSLVVVESGEPPRYRLLETTRAYSLEKLAEHGELTEMQRRHARAVLDLFDRCARDRIGDPPHLSTRDLFRRLGPELDNTRVALNWAMSESGDLGIANALAAASAPLFWRYDHSLEALQRLLALQRHVDETTDAGRAASFWQMLASLGSKGQLPRKTLLAAAMRAEDLYRLLGSRRRLMTGLFQTGVCLCQAGEWTAAAAKLTEMVDLEDPGDPAWLRSQRYTLQGHISFDREELDEALATLTEQRALLEQTPGEETKLFDCQVNLLIVMSSVGRDEEVLALAEHMIGDHQAQRPLEACHFTVRLVQTQLFLGRIDDATVTIRKVLPYWERDGVLLRNCDTLAMLCAEQGRFRDAARCDGAEAACIVRSGSLDSILRKRALARVRQLIDAAGLAADDVERWQREGAGLDQAHIAALALNTIVDA